MVTQLDDDIWFPDPRSGEEDGFLAVGGDLSVDRLILAYSHGIFPWFAYKREAYGDYLGPDEPVPVAWFCPMDRFVFFPDKIHISHSMRNLINRNIYDVTFNKDFSAVINNCADVHGGDVMDWLGPEMIEAYTELHREGFAHSVEVWDKEGNLVGGLYGLMLGKIFYGESMFSIKPNTSKLAFITLCDFLSTIGCLMIDSQVENPHTKSLGGVHITYDEYMRIVKEGTENLD